MLVIKKKFILDGNKRKIAVQLDMETFSKIERVLEDYALAERIQENDEADNVTLHEARAFYEKLEKAR